MVVTPVPALKVSVSVPSATASLLVPSVILSVVLIVAVPAAVNLPLLSTVNVGI